MNLRLSPLQKKQVKLGNYKDLAQANTSGRRPTGSEWSLHTKGIWQKIESCSPARTGDEHLSSVFQPIVPSNATQKQKSGENEPVPRIYRWICRFLSPCPSIIRKKIEEKWRGPYWKERSPNKSGLRAADKSVSLAWGTHASCPREDQDLARCSSFSYPSWLHHSSTRVSARWSKNYLFN